METIRKIRLALSKGMSIREATKRFCESRTIIRKIRRSGETLFVYQREAQQYPELEALSAANAADPPGSGKTHLALFLGISSIHLEKRIRFYTIVDLANELEQKTQYGKSRCIVRHLLRHDCIILDEFGYLPFSLNGNQMLFHVISKLYE